MKTNKSLEETEITPSKKKLKQARLPFKLISDVLPTPVATQTRKRKLSAPEIETVSKVGKLCKENDSDEVTVLTSDDETKDDQQASNEDKPMNPYVKLVDTAWKKKQQKIKGSKKRDSKKKKLPNGLLQDESNTADEKLSDECEVMDIDEPNVEESDKSQKNNTNNKPSITGNTTLDNIVVSDDSNNSSDVKLKTEIGNNVTAEENNPHKNKNHCGNESPSKCDNKDTLNKSKTTTKSQKHPGADVGKTQRIVEDSSSEIKIETLNSEQSNSSPDKDVLVVKETEDAETNENWSNSEKRNEQNDLVDNPVTPTRNTRSKSKMEQHNNFKGSPSNSKINESLSSNTSTPMENKYSSPSNEEANESLNESLSSAKNLTPKQLQKKQEAVKKKEERERERQELEKKRQQEKEERARQKHEKEEQRKREREEKEDQKKREKEEKEEQRKKEREEKEKQKELEKKLREEKEELKKKEKEEKDEQKRKEREAREEEKRKKQEALELEKQEQELKKKKAAEAFANFFVTKQKFDKDQTTVGPVSKNDMLSNFTIKADMRLAPIKRVDLSDDKIQQLDNVLIDQTYMDNKLYLKTLKGGTSKPLSSGKTWPKSDKDDDDDVMVVEDELLPMDGAGEITCESVPREKLRPKLLCFHENRRPPYWGTWRKKSHFIKPRKPFGQDGKQLDYEVDSDEEWEEEQEGESIDGSAAGSDDEQDADEYEVDNEVFVPHGYLSDEEATMDDDDVLSLTPEAQKARLKHLEDEFESEMKKPTEKLKPRMYGLLWQTMNGDKPDKCVDALWDYFGRFSMIMNDPTPILQAINEPQDIEKKKVKKKKSINTENGEQQSPKSDKKKKQKSDDNESKSHKKNFRKNIPEKKKQPSINAFLNKVKSP